MKKIIYIAIVIFICLIQVSRTQAQSLPSNTCGIVYTYDASGNRIKVEYVCNNTPQAVADKADSAVIVKKFTENVIKVDALYPNPTTGQITVRLVKPLQNATIQIMDVAGRTLIQAIGNGNMLHYDLSRFAAGVYFLYIQQGNQKTTMKIIKR